MHWHYKLLRRKLKGIDAELFGQEYEYGLYEFYPAVEDEGEKKDLHTTEPIISGVSDTDVKAQLKFMLMDIDKYGIGEYD